MQLLKRALISKQQGKGDALWCSRSHVQIHHVHVPYVTVALCLNFPGFVFAHTSSARPIMQNPAWMFMDGNLKAYICFHDRTATSASDDDAAPPPKCKQSGRRNTSAVMQLRCRLHPRVGWRYCRYIEPTKTETAVSWGPACLFNAACASDHSTTHNMAIGRWQWDHSVPASVLESW